MEPYFEMRLRMFNDFDNRASNKAPHDFSIEIIGLLFVHATAP